MATTKTSLSHPLRIDATAAPGGGLIGMTLCPGKKQTGSISGNWDRDLAADLDQARRWGAVAVVTLMETNELARYKVAGMGRAVTKRGMAWHHLPIVDVNVPTQQFERDWIQAGADLRTHLAAGRNVLLHCRGGLGRSGTIAARLLVELGVPAETAIAQVRKARPGAIETGAQEAHVRQVAMPQRPPTATRANPENSSGVTDRAGRPARPGRRRRARHHDRVHAAGQLSPAD